MESVLHTPRLKLTRVTRVDRGSEELAWLHALRSDEQSTAWSILAPSKTLEDTEKIVSRYVDDPAGTTNPLTPKVVYAVHESTNNKEKTFIGLVNILPLKPNNLPLPESLVIPKSLEPTVLVVELAYAFLPAAWGKGYATEALRAVLDASQSPSAAEFWAPWERVWMRVIVNGRNPKSLGVMRKVGRGVGERGVYVWRGEEIFIGGEWRGEDELVIFGGWVLGGEEGGE